MSVRVAETITGSASASSWSVAVDLTASCARTADAALNKLNKTKHNGRFFITSFLQLRESDLFPATSDDSKSLLGSRFSEVAGSPSSHSSFCEEVFSPVLLL